MHCCHPVEQHFQNSAKRLGPPFKKIRRLFSCPVLCEFCQKPPSFNLHKNSTKPNPLLKSPQRRCYNHVTDFHSAFNIKEEYYVQRTQPQILSEGRRRDRRVRRLSRCHRHIRHQGEGRRVLHPGHLYRHGHRYGYGHHDRHLQRRRHHRHRSGCLPGDGRHRQGRRRTPD